METDALNTRSRRQLESLRYAGDWHLSMALEAKVRGRTPEAEFHMRHYDLLGPAVIAEEDQAAIAGSQGNANSNEHDLR